MIKFGEKKQEGLNDFQNCKKRKYKKIRSKEKCWKKTGLDEAKLVKKKTVWKKGTWLVESGGEKQKMNNKECNVFFFFFKFYRKTNVKRQRKSPMAGRMTKRRETHKNCKQDKRNKRTVW